VLCPEHLVRDLLHEKHFLDPLIRVRVIDGALAGLLLAGIFTEMVLEVSAAVLQLLLHVPELSLVRYFLLLLASQELHLRRLKLTLLLLLLLLLLVQV
jgi:hypothetical protein